MLTLSRWPVCREYAANALVRQTRDFEAKAKEMLGKHALSNNRLAPWRLLGVGLRAMRTIRLKNGSQEIESRVAIVIVTFRDLYSSYELPRQIQALLRERSLVAADGSIHSSIRNAILSAVDSSGAEMPLGSPMAAD